MAGGDGFQVGWGLSGEVFALVGYGRDRVAL